LGHDDHRRLSKLSAWEEKKSKASWEAQIVDHEKIAGAAVQAMKAADLNRFLVICALVPDLHCPGYNPRQSLEKTSNLARVAIRYKVDPAKVATASARNCQIQRRKSNAKPTSQRADRCNGTTGERPAPQAVEVNPATLKCKGRAKRGP
jgi:hypothetical protein